jgi:hypothetical protein
MVSIFNIKNCNLLILEEINYDKQTIQILAAEAAAYKLHRHVVFHLQCTQKKKCYWKFQEKLNEKPYTFNIYIK